MKKRLVMTCLVMIQALACGVQTEEAPRSTKIEEISDKTQIVLRDPSIAAPRAVKVVEKEEVESGATIDPWSPFISAKQRELFKKSLNSEAKRLRTKIATSENPEIDKLQADLHEASAREHSAFGSMARAAEAGAILEPAIEANLNTALARHQANISRISSALAAKHFEKGEEDAGRAYDEMARRYGVQAENQAELAERFVAYARAQEAFYRDEVESGSEPSIIKGKAKSRGVKQASSKAKEAFRRAKSKQKDSFSGSFESARSEGSGTSSGASFFEQRERASSNKWPARKNVRAASPKTSPRLPKAEPKMSVRGEKIPLISRQKNSSPRSTRSQ